MAAASAQVHDASAQYAVVPAFGDGLFFEAHAAGVQRLHHRERL
jgi:hypothetical protein